jgi:ATP-binding cassette, subfamily B, multidrug efflux pump
MRGGPPGSLASMAQMENERAINRGATAKRLIGEFKPFGKSLWLVGGLVILGAISQAAAPWLVGRAIDENISKLEPVGLTLRMLELLGVYLIGTLVSRQQIILVGTVSQKLLAGLRQQLFMQLQKLPLTYFDKRPIGDLMSRLTNDVDTLSQFFGQGITQLFGSLFGLIGILIAMLFLNLPLALVSYLVIPAMLLTTGFFASRARAAFRKTRETVGDVTADIQQEIGGAREAQAFNRSKANIDRFRGRNAANRDANVQAVGITSAFSPAIEFLSTLATALVIGYGGYLVLENQLTVGLLAAFLLYVQQFFRPVQLLSAIYTQAQSALAGAERIYTILDETPEPKDIPNAKTLVSLEGRIEFDQVSFGYSLERQVLENISFTVEPGQTIALVGTTGAGKTTVANLIPRFYDVTAGRILIDGTDVRDLTRASLRAGMAMVLQEPFLFSGTIIDNIRYGKLEASHADIVAAATTASAHEFISALPQGYETPLGEGGGGLSQGQRQLIAFARAVLANPKLLILDEATANIDTRTENLIQRALETLLKTRTSIVIAHRLSTIQHASKIIVLEQGKILEQGTHEELLGLKGKYAELHARQFRVAKTI